MQLDPDVEDVLRRNRKHQLLTHRHVAHRQIPVEDDIGQTDRQTARPPRSIAARTIRTWRRRRASRCCSTTRRWYATSRRRRAARRAVARRVVARFRKDASGVRRRFVLFVVEPEVGVLAAREAKTGTAVFGAELPPRLELHASERRQVLVGDEAGDQVVLRPPPAQQPRAAAGRGALEHHVGVCDACPKLIR